MTSAALFAYLSYRDAPAALEWFGALGFELVARQDGPGGTVTHAEVRLGSVVLMVSTADADYDVPTLKGRSTGNGLYVRVADVDTVYRRAIAAGAVPVFPPESTEWGTRCARLLDGEGHEWSFGSYEPGRAGADNPDPNQGSGSVRGSRARSRTDGLVAGSRMVDGGGLEVSAERENRAATAWSRLTMPSRSPLPAHRESSHRPGPPRTERDLPMNRWSHPRALPTGPRQDRTDTGHPHHCRRP